MSALTPAMLISIMMRAGASAEEIAEAVGQLLQERSAPAASASASRALPSAGGGGAAASRALPSAGGGGASASGGGAAAPTVKLYSTARVERLKSGHDKWEAQRLKNNARARAKTKKAAAWDAAEAAEAAKVELVLKLIGDTVYMTQNGNVYEWDADAEVRGDYVGRLTGDEDEPSIDTDAAEVV